MARDRWRGLDEAAGHGRRPGCPNHDRRRGLGWLLAIHGRALPAVARHLSFSHPLERLYLLFLEQLAGELLIGFAAQEERMGFGVEAAVVEGGAGGEGELAREQAGEIPVVIDGLFNDG